jgi:hypothetical protein
MHEILEKLHEIEKNLLATYLSSNNSRFFILACPWLVVFSYACFYNSHCIDYILPYRQYHQLLWYLVFQGRQRALTSLLDQLHTVPMRPVKQIPMDRLYNIVEVNNHEPIALLLNTSWVFDPTTSKDRNLYIGTIVHIPYIIYDAIVCGTLAYFLV